jgi:multidrug resistance efflux pump
MTPDQKFERWVKFSIFGFTIVFVYFLLADLAMPITPQAMATRIVTKIAPRVSGPIAHISVKNNQFVKKGDVLFQIDPTPYKLAVEQAQLALDKAKQDNDRLDASIIAAVAKVKENQAIVEQRNREMARLSKLFASNAVSKQLKDDAVSNAIAANANLAAVQAELKELRVQRGENNSDNLAIRIANNTLKQAKLNLTYTEVKAEHDGIITNLQLNTGAYAIAGQPIIAQVDNKMDIIADFREKNLRYFNYDMLAYIAFDSQPGSIYTARVNNIDAGVSSGQFDANGTLSTPSSSTRWVRDAQRMRVHLNCDSPVELSLPSGSRATVQLIPSNGFLAILAKLQIYALSILHYIY